MKKHLLIPILILALTAGACASKELVIGRGDPDVEIQKCIKLSNKKHFEEAVECLEMFKARFPKTRQGIEAELKIGDNYFADEEYLLAANAYLTFIKLYPYDQKIDYAYYRTGLSYLRNTPKAIDRDQEYLEDALAYFKIVLKNFQQSPYYPLAEEGFDEAEGKVAARNFYIARFYYRTGEYKAAIPRFRTVVQRYPQSEDYKESLYLCGKSYVNIEEIEGAKEMLSLLVINFPEDRYTKRLERILLKKIRKEQQAMEE
jgi:outer membrane protein assembly factor BamD